MFVADGRHGVYLFALDGSWSRNFLPGVAFAFNSNLTPDRVGCVYSLAADINDHMLCLADVQVLYQVFCSSCWLMWFLCRTSFV